MTRGKYAKRKMNRDLKNLLDQMGVETKKETIVAESLSSVLQKSFLPSVESSTEDIPEPVIEIGTNFVDRGDWIELKEPFKGIKMIERYGSAKKTVYDDAEDYLENLNIEKLGGFDDWEIPTDKDLTALAEIQNICGVKFKGDYYWSSSDHYFIGKLGKILGFIPKGKKATGANGCYVICIRKEEKEND